MNATRNLRGALALIGVLAVADTACNPTPPPTAKPKASIADSRITEGTGGISNLWFTVNLDASRSAVVRLAWTALDGTATQPADFAASSGTVEFTPGTTTAAVHVPLVTDTADEVDETLRVVLFASTTADVADDSAVGTIVDDDGAPTVAIDDAPAGAESAEGAAGFPVRLSNPSGSPLHVTCRTVDGTAKAGRDFPVQDPCGITIPAGATRADLHVPRTDDNVDEDDESYAVKLLSVDGGATIVDADASTTIFDNDAAPTFWVDDAEVLEGNPGGPGSFLYFTGHLSHPSSRTVTLQCEASSGSATENDDFVDTGGACFSFVFESTTDDFFVPIWEDTKKEDDEDLFIDILGAASDSAPVVVADSQARGIIRNDGDTCRLFC